jgi:hypothetical protein
MLDLYLKGEAAQWAQSSTGIAEWFTVVHERRTDSSVRSCDGAVWRSQRNPHGTPISSKLHSTSVPGHPPVPIQNFQGSSQSPGEETGSQRT